MLRSRPGRSSMLLDASIGGASIGSASIGSASTGRRP